MKNRVSRRSVLAAGAALSAAAIGPAFGQSTNGSPLKILVPFAAGGMADYIARLFSDKLKDELGRPVIVDNKPGAGLRLAAETLKNSPADGNTILLSPIDPITVAPLIYENSRFATKDFRALTDIVGVQFGLVVKATSPVTNLDQYFQAARKDPRAAALGITALGTGLHFFALELLSKGKASNAALVPYKGGPAMVADILGDNLPAGLDATVTMADHHRAGKLRVLAVSGSQRANGLPDVPTFSELGYSDLMLTGRYMFFSPANTPQREVSLLNTALRKVLLMSDVRQKLSTAGFDLSNGVTPDEAAKMISENLARWTPVIKASGFKGD